MPQALPYLPSNKNVGELFSKIAAAKIPPKFNRGFLQTIGLKGSNDRPLIPLLRTLGYVDQAGTPSNRYGELKNPTTVKASLADAVRRAYGPLFDADETAHHLSGEKLKGLIAQVAGTDEDMTARIASTFATLVKLADFSAVSGTKAPTDDDQPEDEDSKDKPAPDRREKHAKGLRPEFHYNIQIHLPANGSEEVYLNIFNALRKVFE